MPGMPPDCPPGMDMPPLDEEDDPAEPPGGCGIEPPLEEGDGNCTPPPEGLPEDPLGDWLPPCDMDDDEQAAAPSASAQTEIRPVMRR